MKNISILLFAIFICKILNAQAYKTPSPDSIQLITTDIDNFWNAFDKLSTAYKFDDTLEVIQKHYLNKASYGLQEYMKASNANAGEFANAIRTHKNYLLSIRTTTSSILNYKHKIIEAAKRLKSIYPSASFPQVYFVMGKFEVGGTQFPNLLYVGAELMCAAPSSPLEEFKEDFRPMISSISNIATVCIHEIIHFQQAYQDAKNILEGAIIEGGADFITYKITGTTTAQSCFEYGYQHEKAIWKTFKSENTGQHFTKWFVNIPDTLQHQPGMLGYFIGFRICEAYYRNAVNKDAALKEIIQLKNPAEIYEKSKYFVGTETGTHN